MGKSKVKSKGNAKKNRKQVAAKIRRVADAYDTIADSDVVKVSLFSDMKQTYLAIIDAQNEELEKLRRVRDQNAATIRDLEVALEKLKGMDNLAFMLAVILARHELSWKVSETLAIYVKETGKAMPKKLSEILGEAYGGGAQVDVEERFPDLGKEPA